MKSKVSFRQHNSAVERRSEARIPGPGDVTVLLTDPPGTVIRGQAVDTSPHGFRMRHDSRQLKAGMVVDAAYPWGRGPARVMWTRECGKEIESGFLLLKK